MFAHLCHTYLILAKSTFFEYLKGLMLGKYNFAGYDKENLCKSSLKRKFSYRVLPGIETPEQMVFTVTLSTITALESYFYIKPTVQKTACKTRL